jgi:hypothetical protein
VISARYDQKGYGPGTSLIPSQWPNSILVNLINQLNLMMFHLFRQHSMLVDLLFKLHLSGLDFLGKKLQTGGLVAIGLVQIFSHIDGQMFQTLSSIFRFLNRWRKPWDQFQH